MARNGLTKPASECCRRRESARKAPATNRRGAIEIRIEIEIGIGIGIGIGIDRDPDFDFDPAPMSIGGRRGRAR